MIIQLTRNWQGFFFNNPSDSVNLDTRLDECAAADSSVVPIQQADSLADPIPPDNPVAKSLKLDFWNIALSAANQVNKTRTFLG